MPFDHLLHPPGNTVGRQSVRENSVTRPHSADVLATVRVLDENIGRVTTIVDIIRITGVCRVGDIDRRIDDGNEMLIIAVKPVKEILCIRWREGNGVQCEVTVLVHVIDVKPDSLHRNVEGA